MNGFYSLSYGSIAYVTGANNISLPKGKSATAVIMHIDSDGKIGKPQAYNYSDENDLVSGIQSICGSSVTNMLAPEGSAGYKALRKVMYNPVRFLEALSTLSELPSEPTNVTKGKSAKEKVPKEKTPRTKEPKEKTPKAAPKKESIGTASGTGTKERIPKKGKGSESTSGTESSGTPKGRPKPVPMVTASGRTITPYEVKKYAWDSPIFFIPSGNNRWIYPYDHDGRFLLECFFTGDCDEAPYRDGDKERWTVEGFIDGMPIKKMSFRHAYEASDFGNDMHSEFCDKNHFKKWDDRIPYQRPKPTTDRLEHFTLIPNGRTSVLGKQYAPKDDRRGRIKKAEVLLNDSSYNINFRDKSWEGVGGPAVSLKNAEMNALRIFDHRYAPSEFAPLETAEFDFIDEYGDEVCPNCGFGKFSKHGGMNECLVCGCVSEPKTKTVHMDRWNHNTFNKYRDRTERERNIMFPTGWRWTPITIDGKKYEYTKDNFDSDRYNVFYTPEMEEYDRRCSKMINFNILRGLDRHFKLIRKRHERR